MNDLSPKGRALVEVARLDGPTSADRARLRAGIAARLALAAAGAAAIAATASKVGAVADAAAVAPTAAVGGGAVPGGAAVGAGGGAVAAGGGAVAAGATFTLGKTIAVAAIFGATTFVGGVVAGRRSVAPVVVVATSPATPAVEGREAPVQVEAHPRPVAAPDEARAEPAQPPPVESHTERAVARPPRPAAAGEGTGPPTSTRASSTLAAENTLLDEAQRALSAGDAAAALRTLDAMAAQHPEGRLKEERSATRILALCAAGRVDEARREAGSFAVDSPGSIHAARLRHSCAGSGPLERRDDGSVGGGH